MRRPAPQLEPLEDRTTPAITFSGNGLYTPGNAMSVAAGDFDGDGDADAVVGSSGGVTVFLNDGTGALTSQGNLGTGSGFPSTVAVVDMTGDGAPDIVVGNNYGQKISVLVGNGDGTFQAPVLASVPGADIQGFAVADFNGDGAPDVAVAEGNSLAVLLNVGAGSGILGAPSYFGAGGLDIATADFDGNGTADLVAADPGGDRLTVYPGNGDGTFAAGVPHTTGGGSAPQTVIARDYAGRPLDFNNDGHPDLAAGYSGSGFIGVLLGNGAGGFSAPHTASSGFPVAGRLTAADFDDDGNLDLIATVAGGGSSTTQPVLAGRGNGNFTVTQIGFVGNSDVAAADLDGDSRPDLLGTINYSPGFLVPALNTTPVAAAVQVTAPLSAASGVPVTVTVTLKAADGTTMTGYAGRVHFSSSDAAAGLPADTQFTAADNGVKSFAVTFHTGGSQTLTVTDVAQPGVTRAATLTVDNHPPTANPDTLTVAEDAPATAVDVLANDSTAPDPGETLSVAAVTQPAHGTVTLAGGLVRYRPAANYYGSDAFTYTASDGAGGTATATVTVTVTPVNDPPTAGPDTLTVAEDAAATVVDVLANDTFAPDTGETLSVAAVAQPAHGTAALAGGVVSYRPAADFNGTDTFTYTLSDGNGGTATGTVTVTVTPVNDPPTANPDTLTVAEDAAATVVHVLANDSYAPDTGETLSVAAVTQPAHGVVSLVGGVVRYAPAADYYGPDAFTYTLSDGNGGTATGTVTVTVTPVNDPPTANPDTLAVAEDAAATAADVLANDTFAPDTGETLTVALVTQPAHGTATLAGGVVRYKPAANYNGTDAFTYTVSDGNGGSAVGTVTVTVTPVNDPPTANPDTLAVTAGDPATAVDVLANDADTPDAGETLAVTGVTQPAHGTATLAGGGVRYQPAAGYTGPGAFTYTLSDGAGGTTTGAVAVTVYRVNHAPAANPDALTVTTGDPATPVAVLLNDSAAPDAGETLAVTGVTQPAHGTATLAGGVVSYTPAAGYTGPDAFTYTLSDGFAGPAGRAPPPAR